MGAGGRCHVALGVRWGLEEVEIGVQDLAGSLDLEDQNIQAGEDRKVRNQVQEVRIHQEAVRSLCRTDPGDRSHRREDVEGSREERNVRVEDQEVVDLAETRSR